MQDVIEHTEHKFLTNISSDVPGLAWAWLGLVPKKEIRKYQANISLKNVSHNMNMIVIWYKNCQVLHSNSCTVTVGAVPESLRKARSCRMQATTW